MGVKVIDKLVVRNDGQLRHVQISQIIQDEAYREPGSMPSDRLNNNPGLTFSSKSLGFIVSLDEPIESYHRFILKQISIEIEDKKREEQWKKIVALAEIVSFFVPVFRVVGISCKLFQVASKVSTVIENANSLYEFYNQPEDFLSEKVFDIALEKGYKKIFVLKNLKLTRHQLVVFESFRDNAVGQAGEKSGLNDKAKNLIQLNTIGYSVDAEKKNKVSSDYDKILEYIHVFRYQYDTYYKSQFDMFQMMLKNYNDFELSKFGIKKTNEQKTFFSPK
jgi:hypothetical protein